MIVLSCKDISKSYGVNSIFENISFNVEDKDKIGLIGKNGSGKTSLLKILSKEIPYDSGEIYISQNKKIGVLTQHINIDSNETLYDECLKVFQHLIDKEGRIRELETEMTKFSESESELSRIMEEYSSLCEEFEREEGYGYKSRLVGTLKGLGFSEEEFKREVNSFSGGQKSRIQLAKLLLQKADILFLDEPTNHLDMDSVSFLEGYLRDFDKALILISHDRYFLDKTVNRIFLTENKGIKKYNGNYSSYVKIRKREIEVLKHQYEVQKKEIKRQQEIIDKFASYGNQRLTRQAQSRKKLLDKMKILEIPPADLKMKINFTPLIESGKEVLKVRNLKKSYLGTPLFENVNFDIYKGEKVVLTGKNGSGKSTLLNIILGNIPCDFGEIEEAVKVNKAYFDQEERTLNENNTVIDEIWDAFPNLNHSQIRGYLAKFMFFGDDIFKFVGDLSGGERVRLSLLKLMLSGANFLLMDEPTNHLDINSKEILEEVLNDYEGTVFIVSHDRYFINNVADKIISLDEKGTATFLGNYDYYIQKIQENEDFDNYVKINKTREKKEKKKLKELRDLERESKRLIKNLEKEIYDIEEKLVELNELAQDPTLYEDNEKREKLFSEMKETFKQKEKLYEKLDLVLNQPLEDN